MNAKKIAAFLVTVFIFSLCNKAFSQEIVFKEASVYFKEGVEAQEKGNFSEAETCYNKVLVLSSNNTEYLKYI